MSKPVGHRSTDYTTPRPAPRGGKSTPRVEPFSAWQLLIENRRVEMDPPQALDALSSASRIPKGTLFNWLRHPEGAPPRKRYTAAINARLARALKILPADLAAAYDASRTKFNPRAPGQEPDALQRFLQTIQRSRRSSWTKADLLKLGSRIASGDH